MKRKYDLRFRKIMKSVEVNIERRNLLPDNKPLLFVVQCSNGGMGGGGGYECECGFECC